MFTSPKLTEPDQIARAMVGVYPFVARKGHAFGRQDVVEGGVYRWGALRLVGPKHHPPEGMPTENVRQCGGI
jgi:hypothetical protein